MAAGLALATLTLTLLLAACCPASVPPPTAFVATLTPLPGGTARAVLAGGRELTLVGIGHVPGGRVYVTGALLPDGRVRVASVQPAAGPVPAPPPAR